MNGKSYIGVTKRGLAWREMQHRKSARGGSKLRFHAALRKHGDDAFVFSVEQDFQDDLELAYVYEAEVIDAEQPAYNAARGMLLTPEAVGKLRDGTLYQRKRRKRTPEELDAWRAARAKFPHPMLGKKHTVEAIANMRAAHLGRPGFWTGKKRPFVVRSDSRSVQCVEDGNIFRSITEAERYYGLHSDSVGGVLRGRIKSTRGLHFVFVGVNK